MTSTLLKSSALIPLNAPVIRKLANGLTIIAEQIPIEAVNLSLWLNVGSAVERDDINGMAHFLEHMVFKGTQTLKSGEFEQLIEQRGAITNAATSHDYTHFYITTAPQDFAQLAPLQLDVVLNPSIPDEAFERERLVVLEEIRRSQDNPRRRIYTRSMELAFEKLPYRRAVLGPVEVIEQLTAQQMRAFHRDWYQPALMTAVAVGNLPVEELIEIVTQGVEQTQTFPNPQAITYPEFSPEPAFTEIIRQEYTDPQLTQARLVMLWRVPGMKDVEQTYALDIAASILSHGRTSRLVQDLREGRGLVTSIAASNMTCAAQGIFYISAQLPVENIPVVEKAIADHIRSFPETLLESEIARVRTQVANRFVFSNETPSDRANLYGYYHSTLQDLAPALSYPARIQATSAQDIQDAVSRLLNPEHCAILVMKPQSGQ